MSSTDVLCFLPKYSLLSETDIRKIVKNDCNVQFKTYDGIFSNPALPHFDIHETIEYKINTILKAKDELEGVDKNIVIFDYGLYIKKLGMAPGATINNFYQAITPDVFETEFENDEAILTFVIGYYDGETVQYFSNNFDVLIKNLDTKRKESWLDCLIPPNQSLMLDINFCDMEICELLRYHSSLFQCQKLISNNINIFQLFTRNKHKTIFMRPKKKEVITTTNFNTLSKKEMKKLAQCIELDDDDLMLFA